MQDKNILASAIESSIQAKQDFLHNEQALAQFNAILACVIKAYENGGRLYIAGNGGSAADAQHLAAELVCRLKDDRRALPAHAMTVDTSTLTAIANDYGYEQLFARQVDANMTDKDIFLGITTSGNSANILQALQMCKEKGITSILFSAGNGGRAASVADLMLLAEGEQTNTIQEMHIVFAHALCRGLELALCAELNQDA